MFVFLCHVTCVMCFVVPPPVPCVCCDWSSNHSQRQWQGPSLLKRENKEIAREWKTVRVKWEMVRQWPARRYGNCSIVLICVGAEAC